MVSAEQGAFRTQAEEEESVVVKYNLQLLGAFGDVLEIFWRCSRRRSITRVDLAAPVTDPKDSLPSPA